MQRPPKKIILFFSVLLSLAISIPLLYVGGLFVLLGFDRDFLAIDSCLDSGGRWDYTTRSCDQPTTVSKVDDAVLPPVALSSPSPEVVQPTPMNAGDLAVIKDFAESYEPKSGREVIPAPPIPNEKVLRILSGAAASGSRDHEKYIILIFLRLSRFYTEHFKQSYELGQDNPLTQEFYRLIDRGGYPNAEFNGSSLADQYVRERPELWGYPLIAAEQKRIQKAEDRMGVIHP